MKMRGLQRRGGRPSPTQTFALFLCFAIVFAIVSIHMSTRLLIAMHENNSSTIDYSWMAPATQRRDKKYNTSPPPLPKNEQYTTHWCHSRDYLPDNSHRASCLFHNMCIVQRPKNSNHGTNPKHEIEFLYVYENDEGKKIKQRIKDGDASFTLGVGPHSGDERVVFTPVPISMNELNIQYPTREYITGASVLFYEYNSENFGHLLTDVLLPIYTALQGFGLEYHEDITLFRYSIVDAIGWSCDFHRKQVGPSGISERYGNVGKHCDRFYNMTAELMYGHRPLQVLNGTTVQPTCFQTLVAGMPMYSDDCDDGHAGRETDVWSLCNHARQGQFWQFRNYILQNVLGESYDEMNDMPKHHKITITQREDEHRGLKNLDQLISQLKDKYQGSDIEVVVVQWEKLSLKDQLDLIRTTTVHITPPGGVSFIALFLPRWATSIRLYTMEYRMEWNIFHYLGYISVEHVDCDDNKFHSLIPLDEVKSLVDEGIKRYDDFRIVSGDTTWKTFVNVDRGIRRKMLGIKSTSAIPRVVYQSWISREMAPKMRSNLDKWVEINDDYKFVFFNDIEQRNWMKQNCSEYWPAWDDMQLPAARADLFRYCILHVNGGVWSDVDIEVIQPLHTFIPSAAELLVVHDGGMSGDEFLYNAFLATVPKHPVLKRAMDIILEHYQIRLEKGAVYTTGPNVLWRAVNEVIGKVQPKGFAGFDEEHKIEYLSFDGKIISSSTSGSVLVGKYDGYLDDATMHGGEPHYGREVTWSTKVS